MLSILLIIPFIGSLSLLFISNEEKIKIISLITSLLALGQSLYIWIQFDENFHEFQFVQEWSQIGFCHFHIGIDGISLFFLILTTFIFTISILASWFSITKNIKSFYISLLVLESLLIAVFIVLDLLLFYITFESVLIPMSLLIGMFGSDKKIKAVFYFFLYTLLGSLFMLFSILFIYSITGTTDLQLLYFTQISSNAQYLIWLGFFVAFVIKTPLIPFHIWLNFAHVNSPLAGSIVLAGILLKLSIYGIIRILLPILPDATIYFTPLIYTLALVSIIYASCATLRQIDMKSIIAYSSIPHMSVVILGVFSNTIQGIEGAIFLSIAHGIVSPALFILVTLLYDRHGTRVITYFRGICTNMPIFCIFFFIFTIANCATPLTANFIGELLSFMGSFQINPIITALAGISMILSAGYSFWLFNRISFGTESPYLLNVRDLSRREFFVLLPLVFITILLGIFPNIVLDSIHFSVSTLIIDSSSFIIDSSQTLNSPLLYLFIPTLLLKKEPLKNPKGGFTVYIYKDSILNHTFSSIKEAAKHFAANPETILNYAKSHKLFRKEFILSLIQLSHRDDSFNTNDSMSTKRKGFSIYVYNIITKNLVIILPSVREAERYLEVSRRTLMRYAESQKLLKEQFVLSFTPLDLTSLPLMYSHSNKYSSTSCTSLTIWGTNLPSLVGYKLIKYELSLFTTLPMHIYYIFIGLILSDANLATSKNNNYHCHLKQSIINVSFLLYCFSILAHYCQSVPYLGKSILNGKSFYSVAFRTRSLPCFTQLRLLFYPNGTKIVPENIFDLITPVSLAYWIMGDGSANKKGLFLCTDSFSFQDTVRLMNVLIIKFNLDCTIIIRDKKYPRIYIKKQSMPHLRQLVLPYMHPSFLYKIYYKPKTIS
jgi:NADH-ubiquinone oxidoreductase chain 4